ncbi:MAG: D-lactate dehydrogenase [Cyanobacteria bacterium J06621_8]
MSNVQLGTSSGLTDADLLSKMREIVGKAYVITGKKTTERFRTGFRSGAGEALCVVCPGTLLEQWQILQVCVAADKIVIMQAANTGLTKGSTPSGSYDRDVVLINTRRMDKIMTLHEGKQVISFPGATLFTLEKLLAPLGREPHSVIGSSSIGASIVGGVCNNSGGSLIERGPAYTELSLYAQIDETGTLNLVNHLDINLGKTPEEILTNLENGNFDRNHTLTNKRASASDYGQIVREIDADTPARFNGDKSKLYESAGCAGKLAVFAVRLDTFPKNEREQVFYIGTNNTEDLTALRRHILANFANLPVSAEYMHREAFNLTEVYGKDTAWMIDKLGTSRLPTFFALKGAVDARLKGIPGLRNFTDRFMQFWSRLTPQILPQRILEYRDRFEHYLILKVKNEGIEETAAWLPTFVAEKDMDFVECTPREAKIIGLHRFAAAGAAIRYMAIHSDEVEEILALDIALRRNDRDWLEVLPPSLADKMVSKLYYGHFMCHVMHQDYLVKKGEDLKAIKAEMLSILDQRGAEYPAEHNVGHLYQAKPDLAEHYRNCDPTNSFNPGIGKMSRCKHYG